MTDQCGNCTAKGNMAECLKLDCGHHETWYAKARQEEIMALIEDVGRLVAENRQITERAIERDEQLVSATKREIQSRAALLDATNRLHAIMAAGERVAFTLERANQGNANRQWMHQAIRDAIVNPKSALSAYKNQVIDECAVKCIGMSFEDEAMFETAGQTQMRLDAAERCAEEIEAMKDEGDT